MKIFLVSRSASALDDVIQECLEKDHKATIHAVPFDICDLITSDLPAAIHGIHFDILINNAGSLVNRQFKDMSAAEILQQVNTNFIAPALLIQKLLPGMDRDKPSHIVNIGSMGGFQGSAKFPGLSVYSATKAAFASLTECLAAELTEYNIYANCLALGAVQTEMLAEAFPEYQAPVTPEAMASFIAEFALEGHKFFNGKVIPVSLSTP
jgi:short-subunit dehydrogenase